MTEFSFHDELEDNQSCLSSGTLQRKSAHRVFFKISIFNFLLAKTEDTGSDMLTRPFSLSFILFFFFQFSAKIQVLDHLTERMHGSKGL